MSGLPFSAMEPPKQHPSATLPGYVVTNRERLLVTLQEMGVPWRVCGEMKFFKFHSLDAAEPLMLVLSFF